VNPALLKLALAHQGAVLADGLEEQEDVKTLVAHGRRSREAGGSEEAPLLVDVVLPADLMVRVPLYTAGSPAHAFTLGADGERRIVIEPDGAETLRHEVRLVPPPRLYGHATRRGIPMHRVGSVVGSYVVLHPEGVCGLAPRRVPCAGCLGSEPAPREQWRAEVDDVVDVVRAAFNEGAAEFVCIGVPLSATEDAGAAALAPYVAALKHHFDTLVAAQLHPPRTDRWVDRTYAMGIDAVAYNLEVHDETIFRGRFPGRDRLVGRQRYHDTLAYAASVFPRGTVWSELVAGLEPPAATMAGIDAIAALGVLPVLGIVPPGRAADAAGGSLGPADLAPLGARLYTSVKRRGLPMGRLRDLSTAVTPLEARFFAGDDARVAVTMQTLARSRLGSLASRSLARFRRRLRVRAVGDSFDASGL
jgi:hypothetical protein